VIEGLDKVESWTIKIINERVVKSEHDMISRISENFGELRGHLNALDPERFRDRGAASFKFASEKAEPADGDVLDLPRFPLTGDLH
jgi:hypothetical protein